jgi:hypothetical protein
MLGLDDWENGILDKGSRPLVPFKVLTNNCMKCYYFIIPSFLVGISRMGGYKLAIVKNL